MLIMRIKPFDKLKLFYLVSALLLFFCCFLMYDFYKCLSGFIANGFRDTKVMLTMVISYFLPVLCFLVFFYDLYVKRIQKLAKIIYSSLVIVYSVVCLVLIFSNIELYVSNNSLGVYKTLPFILIGFPYDMIALNFILIAIQAFNLWCVLLESNTGRWFSELKDELHTACKVKLSLIEYLLLCLPGVFVLVFFGSAFTACFTAIENALYDFRYIYLLLWVMLIPMMNLLYLVFKPARMNISRRAKLISLGVGIGANLIFGILLLVLELTYPDFIVHIGKPLFLIAFSVSLPIEMIIILVIMALGTTFMTINLVRILLNKQTAESENSAAEYALN